tara:strand:- start:1176 stop:1766 length:591 start_codon:yes stop_codon:yes gene_type:complete
MSKFTFKLFDVILMKLDHVAEHHDKFYCSDIQIKNGVQSARLRCRFDADGPEKGVLFQSDTVSCSLSGDGVIMRCSRKLGDAVSVLDGVVLEHAKTHPEEWFGKNLDDSVVIKMFQPTIVEGTDEMRALMLDTDVFDIYRNLCEPSVVHDGCQCVVMMEVVGVYFAKRKFGLRWNVKQILANPTKHVKGYAFDDEE